MPQPAPRSRARWRRALVGLGAAGLLAAAVVVVGLAIGGGEDASGAFTAVTSLGRPLGVTRGDPTGTATVTVLAVTGIDEGAAVVAVRHFVVVVARVCNLPGRPLRRIDQFFRLRLASGRELTELIGARGDRRPDLSTERARAGQACLAGDLTFRVPGGAPSRPVRVLYQPSPSYTYAWRIPA